MVIPITKQNINSVAASIGISASEIADKLAKSESEYKKQQDMESILNFFHADEIWYEKTKVKINQIEKSLPKDMEYNRRIYKMYDWIKNDTKITKTLALPFEDPIYSASSAIEMVFTGKIDTYEKILRWE